jgi:hypothetical protein
MKAELTAADGVMMLHGTGDAATSAVATLFRDLLSLDTVNKASNMRQQQRREAGAGAAAASPAPGLSDAAALAAAFGASPAAVDGQQLALPAPNRGSDVDGDDDDGEGRYDEFQLQQERAITDAWAALWIRRHCTLEYIVWWAITATGHPIFLPGRHCQDVEVSRQLHWSSSSLKKR